MQTLNLTKKYEKYSEYKDSGIEWFGKIPKNWIFGKNNHGVSRHGKIFNSSESTPVLSLTKKGVKIKKDLSFGKSTESYIGHQLVQIGDIVFTPRDFDQTPILSGVAKDYGCISNLYFVVRPNNNMFAEFVNYYWWGLKYEYDYFTKFSSGMRSSFNYTQFKEIPLLIPSINEQKKIVKFLDEKTVIIDQIIDKKYKQIELLREKRTVVINHAVTKGLDLKIELIESGIDWIGKIPKGWEIEKLKRISYMNKKSLSEKTDPDFSFKYFDIGSVDEEEVSNIESEITFEKAPSRARRVVNDGDSIIATVRTYLKAIAFFDKLDTNTIASTGFAVLTPSDKLIPKYLFYYLQSDRFINEVIIRSKGVSYPAITPFDLGSLEMIYPQKKDQTLIIEYLDKKVENFNKAILLIEKSIETLQEFKFSLISNVVTGKIRI